MSRPADDLKKNLVSHLNNIDHTRVKADKLLGKKVLVDRDLDLIYSGLYLELVTSFERFIESLFHGLLCNLVTHPKANPRVTFRSPEVCRDVLHGDREYIDWVPYHLTEKRAKKYFTNGIPFSSLTSPEKKRIERIMYIRNAIAHKSKHSFRRFNDEVIAGLSLLPKERTPSGFLRHVYITSPKQTRYEEIFIDVVTLATRLTT